MITAKNISSATVVIAAQDMNFRRKLAPGRCISISQEVYDELSFDAGFENLVKNGFIAVSGVDAEVNAVIEPEKTVVSKEALEKILEDRNITAFAQIIPNASVATRETIVTLAVEKRIADVSFAALINKYCGVDIVQAIAAAE